MNEQGNDMGTQCRSVSCLAVACFQCEDGGSCREGGSAQPALSSLCVLLCLPSLCCAGVLVFIATAASVFRQGLS